MACERCAGIHTAQFEGKTDKPCKCDCHSNNCNHFNTLWTNGGATATTGDFTFTTGVCTSDGCSTINLN